MAKKAVLLAVAPALARSRLLLAVHVLPRAVCRVRVQEGQ